MDGFTYELRLCHRQANSVLPASRWQKKDCRQDAGSTLISYIRSREIHRKPIARSVVGVGAQRFFT